MDPHLRSDVAKLSDPELLAQVKHLVQREREATVSLIVSLAELDARRLYLGEGYSSLFVYCTQVLHLSEHAAYKRIQAARMVRRFPVILERLEDGSVNLTTVLLLAPHLTAENHRKLLDMARHKGKREMEELAATIRSQPAVPASVRKLPTIAASALSLSAATAPTPRPAVVAPLAPQRYLVKFTASAETYEKLRRAQDLLRHQILDGDPAAIFDRALTVLLQTLTKQKLAATDRPRASTPTSSRSRHIPAEVKRIVWRRDGGQCAFVAANGIRCTERGFLEFHHVRAHAAGGESTADNIQLRCRAHNGYEAELYFGPSIPRRVSEPQTPYFVPSEQSHLPSRVSITAATRSGASTRVGRPQAPTALRKRRIGYPAPWKTAPPPATLFWLICVSPLPTPAQTEA